MRRLLAFQVVVVFVATVVACSSSSSNVPAPESDGGSSGTTPDASSDSSSSPDSASSTGGSDGGGDAADAAPQPYVLTSTALAEAAKFDPANTCNGVDTSPPFTWTAGPAGTMSYAMVLTDKSNSLLHWVIYDIPAATTSLPANVEKAYQPANVAGAKQPLSFNAGVRGYLGPCPPMEHTYEFALYALDVAALPGASMATTREEAVTIIQAHDLAVAKLTGKYAQ